MNLSGLSRSNYVRFDAQKLGALNTLFPIQIQKNDEGLHAIIGHEINPTIVEDLDDDMIAALETLGLTQDDVDETTALVDIVHHAFADDMGGHFVWMEAGYEGSRSAFGLALAIAQDGTVLETIDLNDIYKTPGVETGAQY